MELAEVVRIALIALSYSMILFLIASGLSLTMGFMGIVNMAHGSLYMMGAFLGLELAKHIHNFWLVALIAALCIGIFAIILQRGLLSRLYNQFNEQMLLTLGLVFIFSNLVIWIWGGYAYTTQLPAFTNASTPILGLNFSLYRLIVFAIGIILAAALWWIQTNTRAGATLRAGMFDKQMTESLGVNYILVSTLVFFVGIFVAAFAGFIGTPILGAYSEMGWPFLTLSLAVVVIGGVGRIEGAILGALIVGCVDSLGKTYFPEVSIYLIYVIFILTILIRPTGIRGNK